MGKLLSMTGYGSAKGSVEGQEITVELKSVNNRYLDCSVRLPRKFPFCRGYDKAGGLRRRFARQGGCFCIGAGFAGFRDGRFGE